MRQRGFTMLELMVTVTIIGMTLAVGIPNFGLWIQNTQNRTAAESIMNGVQLARTEAVKRNAQVRFELTDATGKVAWKVGCVLPTDQCPEEIRVYNGLEGSGNSRVGVSMAAVTYPAPVAQYAIALDPGTDMDGGKPAGVTFNGIGRVPSPNLGFDITRVDITALDHAKAKRYVVAIAPGGQVRMCDPTLPLKTNPQGCS